MRSSRFVVSFNDGGTAAGSSSSTSGTGVATRDIEHCFLVEDGQFMFSYIALLVGPALSFSQRLISAARPLPSSPGIPIFPLRSASFIN